MKNKKITNKYLIGGIVAVLLIGVIAAIVINNMNKKDSMNDLKITYSNGQNIKFSNFNKNFTEERTITVKNTSNENRTFSLEWEGVKNNINKQNQFTYEISCTGDRCATLGTSQVPVAGFKVYQQVLIEGGKTQTYTIKFNYKGSEKNADFQGKLKVYSEKVKEEKIKEEDLKIEKPEKTTTKKQA